MGGSVYRNAPRKSLFLLGIGLMAMIVIVGCGSDEKQTATPPSTTTAAVVSPEDQAVIVGYREFWDAYRAASDPMNPLDPRLDAVATGEELKQVRQTFLGAQSIDQVFRGALELAPHVVSRDGTSAEIQDCYFDRTQPFNTVSGAPEGPLDAERQLVSAEMRYEANSWKVAAVTHKGSGCSPS